MPTRKKNHNCINGERRLDFLEKLVIMNVLCPAHLNTLDMLDADKYPQRQELATQLATRATRTAMLEQLAGMVNQAFEPPKDQEIKKLEEMAALVSNIETISTLQSANIIVYAQYTEMLQEFQEYARANTNLDKSEEVMSDK